MFLQLRLQIVLALLPLLDFVDGDGIALVAVVAGVARLRGLVHLVLLGHLAQAVFGGAVLVAVAARGVEVLRNREAIGHLHVAVAAEGGQQGGMVAVEVRVVAGRPSALRLPFTGMPISSARPLHGVCLRLHRVPEVRSVAHPLSGPFLRQQPAALPPVLPPVQVSLGTASAGPAAQDGLLPEILRLHRPRQPRHLPGSARMGKEATGNGREVARLLRLPPGSEPPGLPEGGRIHGR